MRVCVTGATGLIGGAVCEHLVSEGHEVFAICRPPIYKRFSERVNIIEKDIVTNDLLIDESMRLDCVIHAAGRAHVINEASKNPSREYFLANVLATERMATAAVSSGVKRFVHISSLAVHEDIFSRHDTISEASPMAPRSLYARSKMEAEERLAEISRKSDIEVVILRPALVVGPNAPGNLMRLARLIASRKVIPVPYKDNKRSYVALDNFKDLILISLTHPNASGEIFLAAEKEPISTRDIIQLIGSGMEIEARTISVPANLIRLAALLIGKPNLYEKVYGDLVVNASKASESLGWHPAIGIRDAFRACGASYISTNTAS